MISISQRVFRMLAVLVCLALLAGSAGGVQAARSPEAQVTSPTAPDSTSGTLVIPKIPVTPKIDGDCSDFAGVALQQTITYGGGAQGTIFLMHDGTNLYVCLLGMTGSFFDRFGSLYLDPQGDGSNYIYAQKDDYSLRATIPGTTLSSYKGTGVANGYVLNSTLDGLWDGASQTSGQGDMVEWSVSIGRFKLSDCGSLFGLAVYHHWLSGVGDDAGWPSNQWFDQPRTWQLASLQNAPCSGPGDLGKIAYVYYGRTVDAASFYNLLSAASYTVTLVPLSAVLTTDFSQFDLILIADDSGYLNQWGTTGLTASQVSQITAPNKPIIGIGEGGYAFYGQLSLYIGWPRGWHGPQDRVFKALGTRLRLTSTACLAIQSAPTLRRSTP